MQAHGALCLFHPSCARKGNKDRRRPDRAHQATLSDITAVTLAIFTTDLAYETRDVVQPHHRLQLLRGDVRVDHASVAVAKGADGEVSTAVKVGQPCPASANGVQRHACHCRGDEMREVYGKGARGGGARMRGNRREEDTKTISRQQLDSCGKRTNPRTTPATSP